MPINIDTSSPADGSDALGTWARAVYGDLVEIANFTNALQTQVDNGDTRENQRLTRQSGRMWVNNQGWDLVHGTSDNLLFTVGNSDSSGAVQVVTYTDTNKPYAFTLGRAGFYHVCAYIDITPQVGSTTQFTLELWVGANNSYASAVVWGFEVVTTSWARINRLDYFNANDLLFLKYLQTNTQGSAAKMNNHPKTVFSVIRIPDTATS